MAQDPLNTKKEEELESKLSEIKLQEKEDQYKALAQKLNIPFLDFKATPIDTDALSVLPEDKARSFGLAVVLKTGKKIIVAIHDPENKETKAGIESLSQKGYLVSLVITTPETLEKIWQRYKNISTYKTFEVGAIDIDEKELNSLQEQISTISDLEQKINSISATKLLEILLAGALKISASDIHFEPESDKVRLRYRLDGILNDITAVNKDSYDKILNRIKVLSKLKLNIHSKPQDGRFTIRQGIDIEVRVSVLPSEFGETIVMRLLDPRTIKEKLEDLGMREDFLKMIKTQLDKPTGAILTTGPTGSGKTTTLYAFINYLNTPDKKIITIEDPIEYHIEGISQTQVDPAKGYTFSNGLRSIVRQDPDIVLVGEIRDGETSEIALHAALTGHLVLSTIHTNDAAGTIPRLIDLGAKPEIIAPAIRIAMAQRLVRKLCPKCKIKSKPSPELFKKIKETLSPIEKRVGLPRLGENMEIFEPGKCKECNNTGYKGRVGVFEAFSIEREMEKLILSSPAISSIKDLALSQGMITMLQDAYIKLVSGITSVKEIERVLD